MQNKYLLQYRFLILFALLFAFVSNGKGQFPVPDIVYLFDDTNEGYSSLVADSSGNENHAYWVNYWDGQETMYAGYYPDSGRFKGSWHISGYHACCEEMASSSMDFILMAGNQHATKDVEGFKEKSPLFHDGFQSLTVSFWFKSDRNYAASHTPCPPDSNGMHEQEILFSMGNRNALAIQNFKGYYEVRVGYRPEEATPEYKSIQYLWNGTGVAGKQWQHIAVTFDGGNNGELTVYLDGQLAQAYLGDPNPLETGYSEILPDGSSVEFGTQNAGGLFGDPGNGFWGGNAVGLYCVTEADTMKYRTGWPASGDFDDFVLYKNQVLDASQINQLYTNGIADLLGLATSVDAIETKTYSIFPNPAKHRITVQGPSSREMNVEIYNILGKKVFTTFVKSGTEIDISGMKSGIYLIRVDNVQIEKLLVQ